MLMWPELSALAAPAPAITANVAKTNVSLRMLISIHDARRRGDKIAGARALAGLVHVADDAWRAPQSEANDGPDVPRVLRRDRGPVVVVKRDLQSVEIGRRRTRALP